MKEIVLVVVAALLGAVLTAVAFAGGNAPQSTSDIGPWGVVQGDGAPEAVLWNRNTAESYALIHDLGSNPPRFYWVRIAR
jgi:hypothetical protein